MIRDMYAETKPLSAAQIREAFTVLNDALRVRLRLWELIPLEWSGYRIGTTILTQALYHLVQTTPQAMAEYISRSQICSLPHSV
jgi:hypothetical protein